MRTPDASTGGFPDYSVCLWGSRADAIENCDYDERVCRVRVEVLEVLS